MDRFVHETMRVQTAVLERDRQTAKLLILSDRANALRTHAIDTFDRLTMITTEIAVVVAALQREKADAQS
jgi:hypothetical protein